MTQGSDTSCLVSAGCSRNNVAGGMCLKLKIFGATTCCNQDVSYYCRMIQLSQILTDGCQVSYEMLVNLIHNTGSGGRVVPTTTPGTCTSSAREGGTTNSTIVVSYEDDDGDRVVIASCEELEYALSVYADGDGILTLKVEITPGNADHHTQHHQNNNNYYHHERLVDSVVEKLSKSMNGLEDKLSAKVSKIVEDAEQRLAVRLQGLQHNLQLPLVGSRDDEYNEEDVPGGGFADDQDGAIEAVAIQPMDIIEEQEEAEQKETVGFDNEEGRLQRTGGCVLTAECEWVEPSQNVERCNATQLSDNVEGDNCGVNDTDTPTNSTPGDNDSNNGPRHDSDATVDKREDLEVSPQEILFNSVLPLLATLAGQQKECQSAVTRHCKEIAELRLDLQSRSTQLEEWHQTVLDSIMLQTTVFKKRLNQQTGKAITRIAQLESFCKDLKDRKGGPEKKEKELLEKLDQDLVRLRLDIGILVKALVKKVDNDCGDDADTNADVGSVDGSIYCDDDNSIDGDDGKFRYGKVVSDVPKLDPGTASIDNCTIRTDDAVSTSAVQRPKKGKNVLSSSCNTLDSPETRYLYRTLALHSLKTVHESYGFTSRGDDGGNADSRLEPL